MVFGWSKAVIVQRFSVLLNCIFSLSFGKQALLLDFILTVPVDISRFSSIQSRIYTRQENPEALVMSVFGFQEPSPVCLLPTFQIFLCWFYICPGFPAVLGRKNRENWIYPSASTLSWSRTFWCYTKIQASDGRMGTKGCGGQRQRPESNPAPSSVVTLVRSLNFLTSIFSLEMKL